MSDGKIIDFSKGQKEMAAEITLDRGVLTMQAVRDVSDYLKSLPLSAAENDKLVEMMTEMLNLAEQEQYLNGFTDAFGMFMGK